MGTMKGPSRPIRRWKCDDCKQVFDKRYDPQREPVTTCPHCGDPNIHQIFRSVTGRTLDGDEPEMIRG
jgi:putative FmdB family regulatory protein